MITKIQKKIISLESQEIYLQCQTFEDYQDKSSKYFQKIIHSSYFDSSNKFLQLSLSELIAGTNKDTTLINNFLKQYLSSNISLTRLLKVYYAIREVYVLHKETIDNNSQIRTTFDNNVIKIIKISQKYLKKNSIHFEDKKIFEHENDMHLFSEILQLEIIRNWFKTDLLYSMKEVQLLLKNGSLASTNLKNYSPLNEIKINTLNKLKNKILSEKSDMIEEMVRFQHEHYISGKFLKEIIASSSNIKRQVIKENYGQSKKTDIDYWKSRENRHKDSLKNLLYSLSPQEKKAWDKEISENIKKIYRPLYIGHVYLNIFASKTFSELQNSDFDYKYLQEITAISFEDISKIESDIEVYLKIVTLNFKAFNKIKQTLNVNFFNELKIHTKNFQTPELKKILYRHFNVPLESKIKYGTGSENKSIDIPEIQSYYQIMSRMKRDILSELEQLEYDSTEIISNLFTLSDKKIKHYSDTFIII